MIGHLLAGVDGDAFAAGFGLGLVIAFTAWGAVVGLVILRRLLGAS